MARPKRHQSPECSGTLKTLYVRNGDELAAVGTRCDVCGYERPVDSEIAPQDRVQLWIAALHKSSQQLATALRDRQLFEKTMAVMNGNSSIAAQGAPFFRALQRWYVACQLMAIRRQTDPEPRTASVVATLKDVADALLGGPSGYVVFAPGLTSHESAAVAQSDVAQIERVARDVRRLSRREVEHALPLDASPRVDISFRQMHQCLETLDEISVSWTKRLTGSAPPSFDPIDQGNWSKVFEQPWIIGASENVWQAPYRLGEEGVPYDAIEPSRDLAGLTPRLSVEARPLVRDANASWLPVHIQNHGRGKARNLRLFLPGVDIVRTSGLPLQPDEEITTRPRFPEKLLHEHFDPFVQVIAEYEDILGNLFRQYAKVSLGEAGGAILYDISAMSIPYRVKTRIVADERPAAWG